MIDFFSDDNLGAADQVAIAPTRPVPSDDGAVGRLASGGFVVSYIVDRAVKVQIYNADGVKVGAPMALTPGGSTTLNSQPSVAGLAGGGYVVSWVDSTTHVAAQVFDANGNAVTGIFGVGTPTNYQQQPAITGLSNGDFVVTWTFNSSASSIRAQVFQQLEHRLIGQLGVRPLPARMLHPVQSVVLRPVSERPEKCCAGVAVISSESIPMRSHQSSSCTTFAPRRANNSAMAAPIPRELPVTKATLPSMPMVTE